MKKLLVVLAIVLCCSLVYGKGGRGGGGFGSSRSSSSSFRSSSSRSSSSSFKSSTPKSSFSKPSTSKSSLNSSSRPSSNLTKSNTNSAAYKKAVSQGKAFKTKDAAVSDFKSKAKTDPKIQESLKKQYPTSYDKEPAQRPSHIPQTYNNQPVVFNNGGYGYYSGGVFNPLMSYMLLDTMTDAMLMSSLSSHGYHVGAPPVQTVHSSTGFSIFMSVLFFIIFVGVVVFLVGAFSSARW